MRNYFAWLAKVLTLLVLFFIIIPSAIISMIAASQVNIKETLSTNKNRVAVIELTGIIESSKEVLKELYAQVEDESIKGIVLRIDSPGGAVGPSQDIYKAVKDLKAKKPIVASMGSMAASGGLYSALGASKIYTQPGTLTGSIGVIMQVPNFKKVADKVGVDIITVKSGKFKDVGNTFRDMTEEDKAFIQSTVDEVHKSFVEAVVQGRNLDPNKIREFVDGRVILGSQALKYGLVDEIGSVYDAAREVFNILGEPLKEGESPELVYMDDKFSKLKKFLDAILDLPLNINSNILSKPMELKFIAY